MMTASMSNDYESVIIKFRGDLNDTTLVKLCKEEVVLQYKFLIKAGGGKTTFGISIGRFYVEDTLEEVQGNLQELRQDRA